MQDRLEQGLVIRVTGGEVWVQAGGERIVCSLRGRFRVKDRTMQVVAGDRVTIRREVGASVAALEEVRPRESWLSRYAERDRGERRMVANVERLFLVVSVADPPLHPAFLDRVLAAAEWGHAPATIVINKIDLGEQDVAAFRAIYDSAGYEMLVTCAVTGRGVDELERRIGSGVYALVGESGVGKSSLLNHLDPALELTVGDVGERTGRGRHTTAYSQLFPFRDGYLADTPGMQTFRFPGDTEESVARAFPEFERVDTSCRFDPCTHSHEPGCAIKAAVEAGSVAASRHRSYLDILADVRERARDRHW